MDLNKILEFKVLHIDKYEVSVFNLLMIGVIICCTFFLLLLLKSLINRLEKKKQWDVGRKHSLFLILKYIIWVIAIALCLEQIGVKVTILLAGSAALLVGLGIGIQQIFNDIVSGIFILFEGTIKVGDVVEVSGQVCKVKEIELRTSKVTTRDDITIVIPNHKFISEDVVNWSLQKKITRFHITVGVAYGSDVKAVEKALIEAANEHPLVINDNNHKTFVRLLDFGDSSINFEVLFYSINNFRIETTKSEIRFAIVDKFKKYGITIPFPQRDLHIVSGLDGLKK